MPKLDIDVKINTWTLREQMDYRKTVGVNPQYAYTMMAKSFASADGEVPDDAFNIPAEYMVGMAWIAMRRKRPDLTLDETVDLAGSYDALMTAYAEALTTYFEEVEAEEKEAKRPTKAAKASALTTA